MAAPLFWLGAGALALLAKENHDNNQVLASVSKQLPGSSALKVSPQNGAVVCCGIFGMFEHTGIWLDDKIVELKGNGLIRAVSPKRFLQNRSGERIYIACDDKQQPLIEPQAIMRACEKILSYSEYHVLKNNCHKFVWYCLSNNNQELSRFSDLNSKIAEHFSSTIHWHRLA